MEDRFYERLLARAARSDQAASLLAEAFRKRSTARRGFGWRVVLRAEPEALAYLGDELRMYAGVLESNFEDDDDEDGQRDPPEVRKRAKTDLKSLHTDIDRLEQVLRPKVDAVHVEFEFIEFQLPDVLPALRRRKSQPIGLGGISNVRVATEAGAAQSDDTLKKVVDRQGTGQHRRAYDSFKRYSLLMDRIAEATTSERRASLAEQLIQLLEIPAANAVPVARMIYSVAATQIVDNRLRQAQSAALNIGRLLRASALLEAENEKSKGRSSAGGFPR